MKKESFVWFKGNCTKVASYFKTRRKENISRRTENELAERENGDVREIDIPLQVAVEVSNGIQHKGLRTISRLIRQILRVLQILQSCNIWKEVKFTDGQRVPSSRFSSLSKEEKDGIDSCSNGKKLSLSFEGCTGKTRPPDNFKVPIERACQSLRKI